MEWNGTLLEQIFQVHFFNSWTRCVTGKLKRKLFSHKNAVKPHLPEQDKLRQTLTIYRVQTKMEFQGWWNFKVGGISRWIKVEFQAGEIDFDFGNNYLEVVTNNREWNFNVEFEGGV